MSDELVESVFSIGGSSLTSCGARGLVAVVQVVAEEVLVVGVVPGVGLFLGLVLAAFFLLGRRFDGLEFLGGDLFEQGIFDDLLIKEIR